MTASNDTLKAFTDAAADAVAREIATLRSEARREKELRDAEYRARSAELETRLSAAADVERRLSERLASLSDGKDGTDGRDGQDGANGADGRDGVDGINGLDGEPGAAGRDGRDGKDGTDGTDGRDGHDVADIAVVQDGAKVEFAFTVGDSRTTFEVELPEGPSGKDGAPGAKGERGADGRLTGVEPWTDAVHYEGAVRSHDGSTWQAKRDTAKEPPHEDWTCLAERGADGKEGQGFNPRRLWVADAVYKRLDVVALNGGAFVALSDEPGPCPGEGWMRIAQPGKRGERGEKGEKGERGERGLPGASVASLVINDDGVLTLSNADGSVVKCDLYPLLSSITR